MKDYLICLSSHHHHHWGPDIQLITGLQWACSWGKRRSGQVLNSLALWFSSSGLALIYNLSSLNQLASWTTRIGRGIFGLGEGSILG